MEEQQRPDERPANPRRRQRSRAQIFKEAYLPAIIAGIAILLILIFIIGSIVRSVQRNKQEIQASLEASSSQAAELERLNREAAALAQDAAAFAAHFDYESALQILNSFQGDISQFPELSQKFDEYTKAQSELVLWNDPSQVLNLSFQILIADPARAFRDAIYGTSYNRNFVTTGEFSTILQQLYDNGYILVSMSDITDGTTPKELYLPSGKKPLLLTQTQVNYYTYMTDSDGDKLPDKGGAGFASKLILNEQGQFTCEMVDSSGQTLTGDFDLVPILERFIRSHPDFSYKNARAILAVTGYDGLFGYRTNPQAQSFFGVDNYNQQCQAAAEIIDALKRTGYELACYTYANIAYGGSTAEQIGADLDKWRTEVIPILGDVNMLVYARNSDITGNTAPYSGGKYDTLKSSGFTHYLGFCTDGKPWFTADDSCIRQGRIMVSGSNIAYHPEWFAGIFNTATVLDNTRGTIPT
jgi:hypothetical protein